MTDLSDKYVDERLREDGEKTCGPTHVWETQQVCRDCGVIQTVYPEAWEFGEWDEVWE